MIRLHMGLGAALARAKGRLLAYRDLFVFRRMIPALMTDAEVGALRRYAAKSRVLAVEIGSLNGGSTCHLSNALPPEGRVVSIDPFIADSMMSRFQGDETIARWNVRFHGAASKVRFIRGFSYDVAKTWTSPIDFLWIDGSHVYEDVKRDFEDWGKFVVKGGYVLFHDSNREDLSSDAPDNRQKGYVGPTRVCNQIKSGGGGPFRLAESVDSLNVFVKES